MSLKGRFSKKQYNLKSRCYNPKDTNYHHYGGRGIKVCKRWMKFENFRDDMYESFLKHVNEFGEKNTQLERINNNGNYNKKNCRWATYEEQANNRRTNFLINYNGETMTLTQWAKRKNIRWNTLQARLGKLHWSIEKSLNHPVKFKH